MMIKDLALKFLCLSTLFLGCSSNGDEEEISPELRIGWNKEVGYTYFLFTSSENTPPQGKGDYRLSSDSSWVNYTWRAHNIGLYGVALENRAIAHGICPEADSQGHLRLKRNEQFISLENQDILIAKPQKIKCGRSEASLSFQYATSLFRVKLDNSPQTSEYVFSLYLQAQKGGYIDLQNGSIVAEGQTENIYFEQHPSDANCYQTPLLPQTLADDAILVITGIGADKGAKPLGINYPLSKVILESNKQYNWTFTVSQQGIVYKDSSSSPRSIQTPL